MSPVVEFATKARVQTTVTLKFEAYK